MIFVCLRGFALVMFLSVSQLSKKLSDQDLLGSVCFISLKKKIVKYLVALMFLVVFKVE